MRTSSSVLMLTALSTRALGHAPAQAQSSRSNWTAPEIPQPYWWQGPASVSLKQQLSGTQTAIPLPTLPHPMEVSIKTQSSTPIASSTPCETPSPSASSPTTSMNRLPESSFYGIPPILPSTSDLPLPPSSVGSYPSYSSWAPSLVSQPSNSAAVSPPSVSATLPSASQQTYSMSGSPGAVSASTPVIVVPNAVSSQAFTPGVIPSSTPGVIPSYTPGVISSYVPGILPSPASSQTSSIPAAQPSASTTVVSTSQSSALQSITSGSSASAASPISSLLSASSNPISSAQAPTPTVVGSLSIRQSSSPASSAVVANTSASSTLSTTTTASSSSVNAQGTSIPPAPIAGGSSGQFSSRGRERVWWLTFLMPLALLV